MACFDFAHSTFRRPIVVSTGSEFLAGRLRWSYELRRSHVERPKPYRLRKGLIACLFSVPIPRRFAVVVSDRLPESWWNVVGHQSR